MTIKKKRGLHLYLYLSVCNRAIQIFQFDIEKGNVYREYSGKLILKVTKVKNCRFYERSKMGNFP